jgi:hypothetical protein
MDTNTMILAVLAVLVLVMLYRRNATRDGFVGAAATSSCKIDEDCAGDNFCYMGRCWGYWRGHPMPWSNCRNPYCGSKEPSASCEASQGQCLPYCKCTLNRRLGGSIASDCFPKCGNACLSNDDCPPGCPACSHGVCSAPNPDTPVL